VTLTLLKTKSLDLGLMFHQIMVMHFGGRNLTEVMLVLGGSSQEVHGFGGGVLIPVEVNFQHLVQVGEILQNTWPVFFKSVEVMS